MSEPHSSSASHRAVVRLKPKIDPRPLRRGYPWIYANELVTDRRTQALAPGTIVTLEDGERRPLGVFAINTTSKIICRLLDTDPNAVIDRSWFVSRLRTAQAHRQRMFDAPYYRLVHAEADGMPGVVIDLFGDAAVIQPNAAWVETLLDPLTDALIEVTGVRHVVKSASGRARGLEGLDDVGGLLRGDLDTPVAVPMNGAQYMADLMGGQKTGLFYDQRPNHAFAARLAGGGEMLDVFSHVGGFALAALAAGASRALAVDGSAPALELARQGAERSGLSDRFETRQGDAFAVLEALGEEGRQFALVVCDPPAFAPSRKAREAGLRAYERVARLAAPLVEAGGYLVLCSCSHAADLAAFRDASAKGIGRAGRRTQIVHTGFAGADHPQLPQLAESGYLKSVVFRLDP